MRYKAQKVSEWRFVVYRTTGFWRWRKVHQRYAILPKHWQEAQVVNLVTAHHAVWEDDNTDVMATEYEAMCALKEVMPISNPTGPKALGWVPVVDLPRAITV